VINDACHSVVIQLIDVEDGVLMGVRYLCVTREWFDGGCGTESCAKSLNSNWSDVGWLILRSFLNRVQVLSQRTTERALVIRNDQTEGAEVKEEINGFYKDQVVKGSLGELTKAAER